MMHQLYYEILPPDARMNTVPLKVLEGGKSRVATETSCQEITGILVKGGVENKISKIAD